MFLVFDLPAFPLQAVQRLEPDPSPGAAVVTEARGHQSRVIAASTAALAQGVELGQSLAQARSRADPLAVFSRRPAAEEAAMELLFALAYTHTPFLERTAPGRFTLELRGLGETQHQRLAEALRGALAAHRFTPRLGLGPTPDLALFAAQAAVAPPGATAFAHLPLEVARPSPALLGILHRWGLRTLGDLTALPLAEVDRRLGGEARSLWERAAGRRTRVLDRASPPRVFKAYQEIEYTVHTLEPLLFLLARHLEQLTAQLTAAAQCAREIHLTLHLDHAAPYVRSFQLPAPTTDPERLLRVLHLHLEQLRTAEAITGLALEALPIDPPHRQQGLFHRQLRDPWQLLETHSELVGLVGHARVGCPQTLDTHRPDVFAMTPLPLEVAPLGEAALAALATRPERPLRRFRPPLPARVECAGERPIHLASAAYRGRLEQVRGPYRGSGDWWQRDTFWERAEWDATLPGGPALRLLEVGKAWSLEGIYD